MNEESSGGQFFPTHPSTGRDVIWISAISLVYFAAAWLGLTIAIQPQGMAPIWLPAGIFLSAILLSRRRLRARLVFVLFLVNLTAELLSGLPLPVSVGYSLVSAFDAVLSSWLLIRFAGEPIAFRKTREVMSFLAFAIFLSNGFSAVLAAAVSSLIPGTAFWASWKLWLAADGLGNLLVTPLVLSWAFRSKTGAGVRYAKRMLEGAALFGSLALLHISAFHYLSQTDLFSLLLPFSIFPFLLWAALRFEIRGVSLSLFIMAAVAIPYAVADRLPHFTFYESELTDMIVVQLYLAFMSIPSLFLGAVVSERKRAVESLSEKEARLNKAEEIAQVGSWELDLLSDRLIWSDEVYRIFGLTPQAFRATYEAFLEAVHPEDRASVDAAYSKSLREGKDAYEIEHRVVRKPTSEIRYVQEKCRHFRDASGRITRSIGMVHDITDDKRAETILRESEARFRAIFESSPVAIWEEDFSGIKARIEELRRTGVSDLKTYLDQNPTEVASLAAKVRVVEVNQASVHVLGAANKEQLVRELPHYFTARSIEVFKEQVVSLAEGRTRFHAETHFLNVEGKPIVLDLNLSIQPGHEDTLSRALVSFVDITERVRAEAAFRALSRKNEEALRVARMGHWEFDIATGMFTFNDQYYRLHGMTAVEAGGYLMSARDFATKYVHPEDSHEVQEAIQKAIAADDPGFQYQIESRILRFDGEPRDVTVWFRIEKDRENKTVKMYGVNQDITERRRAEVALRESEERFRTLIEQAGDGFALLDAEGRFIDVNSATCRQLGYSREELLQLSILDVEPQLSPEKYAARFQSPDSQSVTTFESTHRRKNGTTFPVEVSTSIIRLGELPRALTLVRDITERKRAEEEKERLQAQLIQAQKMESVGRLAGGVAHDFNNMLGVILGHAELALLGLAPDAPLRDSLQEIQAAASRSANLTRQLLAFARKQTIAPRVLDLNDAVAASLKMLQRLIGEEIELVWLPGSDMWQVKMDPAQIDQILANLCVNARDAIGGVGKITIETEKVAIDEAYCLDHPDFYSGKYAMLAVSDDGCGMSRQVLDHVFEPFYTTKDVGQGTGLGLATVYGIVRQNEGFINAYSEPGKGTTFKIYLPRFTAEAISEPKETEEAPREGAETVLLVEDEKRILKLGASILASLGYTVLTAQLPSEALALASRHEGPLHLLISDVVMPEMNGKELRDRLAKLRPEIKTLFMSGYTSETIAHRGILDEGVQFLQKPFSIKGLATKVRAALDQK